MPLRLLLTRNKIYYFRWQLPRAIRDAIQQREFVRSLGTPDYRLAMYRALPLFRFVDTFKGLSCDLRMKKLTEENFKQVARLIWELYTSPSSDYSRELRTWLENGCITAGDYSPIFAEQGGPRLPELIAAHNQAKYSPQDASNTKAVPGSFESQAEEQYLSIEEMDKDSLALEEGIRYLKKALLTKHGGYTFNEGLYEFNRPYAALDLLSLGINDCNPEQFQRLLKDYVHLSIHNLEKIQGQLQGVSYSPPDYATNTLTSQQQRALPEIGVSSQTVDSNLLSTLWAEYKEDKIDSGSWSNESDIAEYDSQFSAFLELIGGDIPCHEMTKDLANRFRAGLKKYPKHRRQFFGRLPLDQVPDTAEKISDSTASQRLILIKSFFKYLVSHDYIDSSPLETLTILAKRRSYATYTSQDLRELFNLPRQFVKRSWHFWIPRIALFTGARQDEIAQLKLTDVKCEAETGIWYFQINDMDGKSVKTAAAIRRVPIHSELIDRGFIDYTKEAARASNDSGSLWPDLRPKGGKFGQTVSRYWTELNTKHRLLSEPLNHKGEKKVFHSFRRVVITKLRAAEVETETVQLIVGHEPELGTTRVYLDDIAKPLPVLKRAIEQLRFEEVGWESWK